MVLLFVLAALATARLTRLITHDAILDRPRALVQKHGGDTLTYFVQCPWCVSTWAGAGVAALTWVGRHGLAVEFVWLALAASYVCGVLALLTARLED